MVNNLIFYENIYVTSDVIDSVWRSLILSTKIYNEFCIDLCGGYIDRIESISSDKFLLKSTQLKEYLEYHQKLIKSLEVFWKIRNDDNFEYDSKLYNIAIKKSELNDVLGYVEDKVAKLTHYFNIDKVYHYSEILYSLILLQHKDLLANENETLNQDCISKYPKLFRSLLSLEFPCKLLSTFTRRYYLTESDGLLIMIEYLKFMTICKLYGGNFSPSSWVDEFWHHHMSFDTRHYREFCLNVYGEWIEHSEIDYKNLNILEQSQLMEKDSKFREAYFECFNHEPIECIWPEIISEHIEEPDKFVVMNLMKMLITKKIVKDVNVLAIRNQYQAQLEEYKNDHGTFSNIIPNFFNKLIGGKKEKSVKEFQKEIEQKIQVNWFTKILIQKFHC